MRRYIMAILISPLLLQGCSTFDKHHGVNWGEGSCPVPSANEKDASGRLKIEEGKTLKCQIRPYVSNMACQGITDNTNDDGVICQNGEGKGILFIFDKQGVLKGQKSI